MKSPEVARRAFATIKFDNLGVGGPVLVVDNAAPANDYGELDRRML